jgi:hypothetical protein
MICNVKQVEIYKTPNKLGSERNVHINTYC